MVSADGRHSVVKRWRRPVAASAKITWPSASTSASSRATRTNCWIAWSPSRRKANCAAGMLVEHALDVVGHVHAADRHRHAGPPRPLAHLAERVVGHREHAGDADQVRLEGLDRGVELGLPDRVERKVLLGRGGVAGLQHRVVEVDDSHLHADPAQLLGEHGEAVGRKVGGDAAARGCEAEEARVGVGRIHQQDAVEPAVGELGAEEGRGAARRAREIVRADVVERPHAGAAVRRSAPPAPRPRRRPPAGSGG